MSYTNPTQVIDRRFSKTNVDLRKVIDKAEALGEAKEVLDRAEAEKIGKEKEAIQEKMYGYKDKIESLPDVGKTFDQLETEVLSDELDRIHQLGIKSIGGDQSEYRQALKQFENNLVADQTFLGLLNKEAEAWENAVESGNTGSYLTHAPQDVQDQRNLRLALIEDININDGKNLKTSYDNGVKILTFKTPQNGYTLKNGTTIPGNKEITINSKEYLKDGKGLVKYQEDLSTNISDIWNKYKGSYDPIKEKLVEKISATGTTALGGTGPGKQTREWKDYEKANELLEQQLNEDLEIEALINVEGEMLHQQFVNDNIPYTGTPAQKAKIKEKLIEHIKNRYGQQDKITSTITVDTSKAP